jgi:hypothetical protein
MDFNKMKDQFSEETRNKVKQELDQKVDEAKRDIEKRFGLGGQDKSAQNTQPTNQASDSSANRVNTATTAKPVGSANDDVDDAEEAGDESSVA